MCENCGTVLPAPRQNLMRMQTVFTRRRQRISSDEEERRRAGFELETSYRFSQHGPQAGRSDAKITADDLPLAQISYGDTAVVRVTNLGRRRRRNPNELGYWLDTVKGNWLSEKDASDATPDDDGLEDVDKAGMAQKVIPYVEDTRNIAVLRLATSQDETVTTTLRYALERGIEAEFQLEDSELSSESLPDSTDHGRMLFTESAEGGAGVLRRLVTEPDALARVAARALGIAHFTADGTDTEAGKQPAERCEKACYDCLLSYGNQLDHTRIDRHAVRDLLLRMTRSQTTPNSSGANSDPSERMAELRALCATDAERALLDALASNEYRLPDAVHETVGDAHADFVFHSDSASAAVFVDEPSGAPGPGRDDVAEDSLFDRGWSVIFGCAPMRTG